jgi:acetyl esterase/lipase
VRDDANSDGGRNITGMTLWSWSRVFNEPIDDVIEPDAMPAVDALSHECIESIYDMLLRHHSQQPLAQHFLSVSDVTQIEPWRSLLLQNIPGPLPPSIPVFIAQGDADTLVLPAVTRAYMNRLCAGGSSVQMLIMPGVRHGFAGRYSAGPAVAWMSDRMAGQSAPNFCGGRR